MLTNFRFALYRFTYIVKEPLTMPLYKGNVFRSRLGYILRGIACIGNEASCEKHCEFPSRCIYSKLFETPVPKDSPVLKGQPFAPHPFVLTPPLTRQTEYEPGETFCCHLILIGSAINLLPWMVFSFDEMGKRGRCQLEMVECLPSLDSQLSQTIYTGVSKTLLDPNLILTLDDVMKNTPQVDGMLELEFLTPTSIKAGGQWTEELTFDVLIRNLLRRTRFLSYFHCGEDLEIDHVSLLEKAEAVKHKSMLKRVEQDRWSYRAKKSIPMHGFVGRIRYEGDLEPFLPLIFLGEYLHIGHNTAFGYGKYRIRVEKLFGYSANRENQRSTMP